MSEFSDDAKQLMCGLFFSGRGTVKSNPPHALYLKKEAAFKELLDAGLITKKPFNNFDIWLYEPTPAMEAESVKHREWYWSQHSLKPSPTDTR